MRVLVTGGYGAIGCMVVRELVGAGIETVVLDLLAPPTHARGATAVRGSVTDPAAVASVFQRHGPFDAVVHMAVILPEQAEADPVHAADVNVTGTVRVVTAAAEAGVRRLVYFSSKAAYGPTEGEYGSPTYRPVPEEHPCRPDDMYGVTKVAGEAFGHYMRKRRGLEFAALRLAGTFGPGKLARHGKVALLSRIYETALKGMPVRADGGQARQDIVYNGDVARGVLALLRLERPPAEAYNLGSGVGITLDDYARAVRTQAPGAVIEIGPGLDPTERGGPHAPVLDPTRARTDLGFRTRPLEEALADYRAVLREIREGAAD
jgi:UDP-glucose 4-epimerase